MRRVGDEHATVQPKASRVGGACRDNLLQRYPPLPRAISETEVAASASPTSVIAPSKRGSPVIEAASSPERPTRPGERQRPITNLAPPRFGSPEHCGTQTRGGGRAEQRDAAIRGHGAAVAAELPGELQSLPSRWRVAAVDRAVRANRPSLRLRLSGDEFSGP